MRSCRSATSDYAVTGPTRPPEPLGKRASSSRDKTPPCGSDVNREAHHACKFVSFATHVAPTQPLQIPMAYQARWYCSGASISTPDSCAARRGKYGSRSSSRAGHHQRRTAERAAAQVHQVPVVRHSVDRGVLAHGRHRDAVAQGQRTLHQGLQQGHGQVSSSDTWMQERSGVLARRGDGSVRAICARLARLRLPHRGARPA